MATLKPLDTFTTVPFNSLLQTVDILTTVSYLKMSYGHHCHIKGLTCVFNYKALIYKMLRYLTSLVESRAYNHDIRSKNVLKVLTYIRLERD